MADFHAMPQEISIRGIRESHVKGMRDAFPTVRVNESCFTQEVGILLPFASSPDFLLDIVWYLA